MLSKFKILCMLVKELDLPLYQVFYPEMAVNFKIKDLLIKELNDGWDYDMKIILSVVKSFREIY